ncbi:hypothetical protein H5410_002481 [Solanum commersonii]|uniref:Uncharacterized protein n=1 Tax=Solanum commersonii TaxID=4109 RepID=A0A9J6B292_SOLCO|nr:hypothetical protein H5410_002481 [Solanum commersonii]
MNPRPSPTLLARESEWANAEAVLKSDNSVFERNRVDSGLRLIQFWITLLNGLALLLVHNNLEGSRITNDITREEDQHNHLIVDLNGEPLQLPIQPPPENTQPERRSTRGSKPPIWMKEFVSLNIHQD